MSREALHESLSAVMDNEADELELRRVLAASSDAELKATWSRYQIARAAMHKELLEPRLDIAAAVSAAIADEPAIAAATATSEPAAAAPAESRKGLWRGFGRVAIAASVTVAVLAGVKVYNQTDATGPQMAAQPAPQTVPQQTLAAQPVQSQATLAGFNEGQGEAKAQALSEADQGTSWQGQRLPAYIRQHAQQAAYSDAEEAAAQPIGAEAE